MPVIDGSRRNDKGCKMCNVKLVKRCSDNNWGRRVRRGRGRSKVTKPKAKMKQRKEKKTVGRGRKEWSGVIKNNDHFAISWQITIHQIVQITDISQWREHFGTLSTSQPLSLYSSCFLQLYPSSFVHPFWWVASAAVRMATAIRLHQFYGNKLLLCLCLLLTNFLDLPLALSFSSTVSHSAWQLLASE